MPERVVGHVRDPGVETDLGELPPPRPAQALCEPLDIIARVGVAERLARGVEEILPVDEGHRALDGGFRWAHDRRKE